jgi:hypothetical protein
MSLNYYHTYYMFLTVPYTNILELAKDFVDDACGGECCADVVEFADMIEAHWIGTSNAP